MNWNVELQDGAKNLSSSLSDTQSITPIDLDRTRLQLGLGDDFICSLMKDFNQKYATFEEMLRRNLKRSDYKAARIYIHTLVGLTGTIAADEHHQTAKELESKLAMPNADIDISSIVVFRNRLRSHISAITGIMENINTSAPAFNNTGTPN